MPFEEDGIILMPVMTSLLGPNGRCKTIVIVDGILG
jgi:hypothetical protein